MCRYSTTFTSNMLGGGHFSYHKASNCNAVKVNEIIISDKKGKEIIHGPIIPGAPQRGI